MPRAEGSIRHLARVACACLALACVTLPWPDEAGLPVPLSQFANVADDDAFLAALTEKRRLLGLPEPLVTPRYQREIRTFATDLQIGKTSAPGALRAIESWGRAAYQRDVDTWVIDCASGSGMPLPPGLVQLPSAVISYASAHFRPRSMVQAPDQCAVLVVALTGADRVLLGPSVK